MPCVQRSLQGQAKKDVRRSWSLTEKGGSLLIVIGVDSGVPAQLAVQPELEELLGTQGALHAAADRSAAERIEGADDVSGISNEGHPPGAPGPRMLHRLESLRRHGARCRAC